MRDTVVIDTPHFSAISLSLTADMDFIVCDCFPRAKVMLKQVKSNQINPNPDTTLAALLFYWFRPDRDQSSCIQRLDTFSDDIRLQLMIMLNGNAKRWKI